MIRVVIADDHHLVRQGIRMLIEKSGEVRVVGEAEDGQQAVQLAQQLVPDVVVVDVAMPRLNGIEAIGRIRGLGIKTRTLVLSMYTDPAIVRRALDSGAGGYLLKRSLADELLLAIRAVSRGGIYLSPEVSGPIVSQALHSPQAGGLADSPARLSPREREVLQLIAEGRTNREMAQLLGISEKTVEKHRGGLMAKLALHNTAALVRYALRHSLIQSDP